MSAGASTGTSATERSMSHLRRLRQRLRMSGALPSSRSIVSKHDEVLDEDVVDVGQGKHANIFEHFLARLEQHGLRRCFCDIEPPSIYGVAPYVAMQEKADAVSPTPAATPQTGQDHPNARNSYYYCCVPCELRLTLVSTEAASLRVLQDAHHHFAGAAHRRAAALMGDSDIDATLSSAPTLEQTHTYRRVFVNGLPMLLSRRPGGGDLFYPLAFEEERCGYVAEGELPPGPTDVPETGDERPAFYPDGTPRPMVFPPGGAKRGVTSGSLGTPVFWYNPIETFFTQTRQIPHVDNLAHANPLWRRAHMRQSSTRAFLSVHHIPVEVHRQTAAIEPAAIPLHPQVLALVPQRLHSRQPKRLRAEAEDGVGVEMPYGHSTLWVYTQAPHTVETLLPTKLLDAVEKSTSVATRCVVHGDDAYRVALVSELTSKAQVRVAPRESSASDVVADTVGGVGVVTASLTEDALRRHVASLAGAPVHKSAHVHSSYLSLSSRHRGSRSRSKMAPTEAPTDQSKNGQWLSKLSRSRRSTSSASDSSSADTSSSSTSSPLSSSTSSSSS